MTVSATGSPTVGMWTWEIFPDRVFADPVVADYFGMDETEGAVGWPVERFFSAVVADDRARVRRGLQRALRAEKTMPQSFRVKSIDGSIRSVIAHGSCFLDMYGKPRIFTGSILDLTSLSNRSSSLADLQGHLIIALHRARALKLQTLEYFIRMASMEAASIALPDREAPDRE